jgi:hypothetical protein
MNWKLTIALALTLACGVVLAGAASGSPERASGTLQLDATLTQSWRLDRAFCPPGTPPAATCLRSVGEAEVAGLGRVTSTYSKILPGDDDACIVIRNNTAIMEVAGKGTLELTRAGKACDGPAPRVDGPFDFTVTGSGMYAEASGNLVYRGTVSGLDGACQCGTALDTWKGTITVSGLDFDTTAPTFTGAVSKTVRAPKGAKQMRVRYAVTAKDAVDGLVSTACTPRSGSLFRRGRTKVTCAATDSSGNTANATFVVIVKR